MKKISFKPSGVCSRQMDVEVDGDIIKKVEIHGGCAGNSKGVARLVEGMDVNEAVKRLEGIECGYKGTSCPDQLAKAIIELTRQK